MNEERYSFTMAVSQKRCGILFFSGDFSGNLQFFTDRRGEHGLFLAGTFRMVTRAFRTFTASLETLSSGRLSVAFRDFSDGSPGDGAVSDLVRFFHGCSDRLPDQTAGNPGAAIVSGLCVPSDYLLPSGCAGVCPLGISEDKTAASCRISGFTSAYGAGSDAGGVGKPGSGSLDL